MSTDKNKQVNSERRAVTRAAGIVGFWTGLSRILGFIRDMVTATFLGAGPAADAFFVAFRIPNLLRRLFAEGALSAAFIPTFVETLHKDGKEAAAKLATVTLTFASLVLAGVTLFGIWLSPYIVEIIAPGFLNDPGKFSTTVELNRIMFPYIFFISLTALASGVLNSLNHFAAPAAAPIFLNLCMIVSVLVGTRYFSVPPELSLAWAVLLAGAIQLGMQVPFMSALGMARAPSFDFRHPALKRIGKLFIPAAFGGAVYQINVLVGTILASMLPAGGVSWLYYADRLVELPLGVFAIALGTAVLPSMSRLAASKNMVGLAHSVAYSLRLILFFTIPASIALIILRIPIIALLFQRGMFTAVDTKETAHALLWYTVGLWAFSGLKVVTQAFFSLKDTRTPVWISVMGVIVNLVGGLALMGSMQQAGLALATSLSAAVNILVLFWLLVRKLGTFPAAEFLSSVSRTMAASLIMSIFLYILEGYGNWELGLNVTNLSVLALLIGGGLAIFSLFAFAFRCPEMNAMINLLKR